MGDFEEVERLQAGIRAWLLRMARSGRDDLRDISAQAVLPWLCAPCAVAQGVAEMPH